MSKFSVQLLLSVLIAVSATLGFSPNAKGELSKTGHAVKVSLRETIHAALGTVSEVAAHVNEAVSGQVKVKSSIAGDEKADIKAKNSSDVQVITGGNLLDNSASDFSLDSSLTTDSQTNAEEGTQGLDLNLKDKTKSTLDVGLNLGK